MATLDKYNLSTTLNDEDLLLVAKYDTSSRQYVDYNKYKVSSLKTLIQSINGGGSSAPSTGGDVSLDYNDYTKVISAAEDDAVMIAKYNKDTDTYEDLRIISVANLKGTGKIEKDYAVLEDQMGTKYRLYLAADGNSIKIDKEDAFAERELLASQATNFRGVLINTIYGAGSNLSKMPVSHNFIELYNLTNVDVNLTGLHLHYKDTSTYTDWQTLKLKGVIPAYSSFLIVGGRCSNKWDTQCRHHIKKYDMMWPDSLGNGMKFSDNGFSVVLSVTDKIDGVPDLFQKDPVTGTYTTNPTDNIIDILGIGGESAAPPVCDIFYRMGMNKRKAGRRVDFYNRFNKADFSTYTIKDWCKNGWLQTEIVDLTSCPEGKFPKCSLDGVWDMFDNYNDMFDENGINYFNLGMGETPDVRTFVFQTKAGRDKAYVWYRKQGSTEWNSQECTITKWSHPHLDVNINKAVVKGLELGVTYEYQVGTEGIKSGIHTFETQNRDLESGDTIRILWTSDPQSWNETELHAYNNVCSKILTEWEVDEDGKPNFELWWSTGDEVQNGNRQNPEMYGSNMARGDSRWSVPFMENIGNNDLYLKKYGQLFQVNFCNDQSNPATAWSGFFHCQIDDVLFVAYSSNEDRDYVAGDADGAYSNDPVLGGHATWDEYLQAEADALDALLHEKCSGPNPPRWIIASTHQMPFTCVRQQKMQKFIPVLEKYNVDLHMGGHQHNVSVSKPIKTGYDGTSPYNYYYDPNQSGTQQTYIDESDINKKGNLGEGVTYVSVNSSGWKCSGKQKNITKKEWYIATAIPGNDSTEGNWDYYSDSYSPWWYDNGDYNTDGYKGSNSVTSPTYQILEISKDTLRFVIYQVEGSKAVEDINGNKFTYAKPFSPEVSAGMSRKIIYERVINKSDRSARPTGE